MSALISGVSTEPMCPSHDSGHAEPSEEMKNSTPATIRPPRRPRKCARTPPTAPPIRHPQRAPALVKPSRLRRAPSDFGQPHGRHEVQLDRFGRAGDDGGVITEQQSAERGNDREGDEKAGMRAAGGARSRSLRHALSPWSDYVFQPARVRIPRPPSSGRRSVVIAVSDSKPDLVPRSALTYLLRAIRASGAERRSRASRARRARGDPRPGSHGDPSGGGSCAARG
jgi:hypothetical protein